MSMLEEGEARKRKGEFTTIWVSRDTKRRLDRVRRPRETNDELLNRILEGEGEVFVQFWSVDQTPAIEHNIVFSLGDFYYVYEKGEFTPIPKGALRVTVSYPKEKKEKKNENSDNQT